MPFNRPKFSELKLRITSDLGTRVLGTPVVLRRAVIAVLGTVMAGAVHLLYGYLDWLTHQILPDDPNIDPIWLQRWGSLFKVYLKQATYNSGQVTFSGIAGSVIQITDPTNPPVLTRADGTKYYLNAEVDFPSSGSGTLTATGTVTAADPGSASACDAGTVLTLQSPVPGVSATVIVGSDGISGGFDVETFPAYQARVLFRIQNPSRGGNDADYIFWSESIAGVTRAFVYPKWLGIGTVGVSFVCDNQVGGIIPSPTLVSQVQAYINTQKPSHADVTVFAPIASPLNFTIHISPDSSAIRAQIQANLQDLISSEGNPGSTLLLSHIEEAIGQAVGSGDFTLSAPTVNQTYDSSHIPTMGTITWV